MNLFLVAYFIQSVNKKLLRILARLVSAMPLVNKAFRDFTRITKLCDKVVVSVVILF